MRRTAFPLILLTSALVAAEGHAQAARASDQDALAAELRLLRQAVEKQTTVYVRSQLLLSRLFVQSQRVGSARNGVDRTAEAADAAEQKQGQARESLATAQRALANAPDEPRRLGLELEVEALRASLAEQDRTVSGLRLRRQQAEQALAAEERSYEKLEEPLAGLDQALQQRPGS